MKKYFTEFTFKADINTYWLPMLSHAQDRFLADFDVETIRRALEQNYHDVSHSVPKLVLEDVNFEQIRQYINQKLNGKILFFELNVFQFTHLPFDEHVTVEEVYEWLADNERPIKEYSASLTKHRFPIRVYPGSPTSADNVYLAISLATGDATKTI